MANPTLARFAGALLCQSFPCWACTRRRLRHFFARHRRRARAALCVTCCAKMSGSVSVFDGSFHGIRGPHNASLHLDAAGDAAPRPCIFCILHLDANTQTSICIKCNPYFLHLDARCRIMCGLALGGHRAQEKQHSDPGSAPALPRGSVVALPRGWAALGSTFATARQQVSPHAHALHMHLQRACPVPAMCT